MIFDNDLMIADDLAHDGSPTVIDLGSVGPGPGSPIRLFLQGHSIAGATGFAITDGATSTATDALLTITIANVSEVNGGLEITLPSNVKRYLQADWVGTTSAGTWTCGVVIGSGQTNF